MTTPVQASPGSYLAHTCLRLLAWVLPGFCAPALLFVALMTIYYSDASFETLVTVGTIAGALLLVLACGFFDGALALTRRVGFKRITLRHLSLHAGFFLVIQLALTPLLGLATAFSCTSLLVE